LGTRQIFTVESSFILIDHFAHISLLNCKHLKSIKFLKKSGLGIAEKTHNGAHSAALWATSLAPG
jgi:hypothetical protein